MQMPSELYKKTQTMLAITLAKPAHVSLLLPRPPRPRSLPPNEPNSHHRSELASASATTTTAATTAASERLRDPRLLPR
jgi:hypothetical protein